MAGISERLRRKLRGARGRLTARYLTSVLIANQRLADEFNHRVGLQGFYSRLRLDETMPAGPAERFEDLAWLFASNYANRNLTLLMFDEAAWLYRHLSELEQPRVAELGRAKGGTTVLLAAAGAEVVSVDNGAFERAWSARHGLDAAVLEEGLITALERAGLRGRVDLQQADAAAFPVPPDRFDLVFYDIPLPEVETQRIFDRWWPGVRTGGMFILRDGREQRVPGAVAVARSLAGRPDVRVDEDAPGLFVTAIKTVTTDDRTRPPGGGGPVVSSP